MRTQPPLAGGSSSRLGACMCAKIIGAVALVEAPQAAALPVLQAPVADVPAAPTPVAQEATDVALQEQWQEDVHDVLQLVHTSVCTCIYI